METTLQLWMWTYNGEPEFGYRSEDIVHAYTRVGPSVFRISAGSGHEHRWVEDITDLKPAQVVSETVIVAPMGSTVLEGIDSKTLSTYLSSIDLHYPSRSQVKYLKTLKEALEQSWQKDTSSSQKYQITDCPECGHYDARIEACGNDFHRS